MGSGMTPTNALRAHLQKTDSSYSCPNEVFWTSWPEGRLQNGPHLETKFSHREHASTKDRIFQANNLGLRTTGQHHPVIVGQENGQGHMHISPAGMEMGQLG